MGLREYESVAVSGKLRNIAFASALLCCCRQVCAQLIAMLAVIGLSFTVMPGRANAQATGVLGWQDTAGTGLYYSSPEAACQAQYQHYMGGKPNSRFIGQFDSDKWYIVACKYTTFQYLCPAETGGGASECGTVLPNTVEFKCATGYLRVAFEHCVVRTDPERDCNCKNNGGRPTPMKPNPISLRGGSKLSLATDFATDDGRFNVSRTYRSTSGVGADAIKGGTHGLAGGWNFGWSYELHLGGIYGTTTNGYGNAALLTSSGEVFEFKWVEGDTSGNWPGWASNNYAKSVEHKLKLLTPYPSRLETLRTSQSDWQLTDGDDTVWLLRTAPRFGTSEYTIAKPLSRTWRDGYQWNFTYNADNSLASITDSFGRTMTFEWRKYYFSKLPGNPIMPEAIESIALPDQTSLKFTYDVAPSGSAGVNGGNGTASAGRLSRLTKVERLDAAQAVIDSTTYVYEDTRYRNGLTGVIDHRGNRIRNYAYDAVGQMATLTEGWNSTERNSVTYTQDTNNLYSVVTGPLGKVETYRFQRGSTNPGDFRFTSLTTAATANTPATTRTMTYPNSKFNPFLTSETDENGHLTTYVRDTLGRPTSMTEASGTPQARTTTYTYHSTLNLPATITRPGLTEARTYSAGKLATVTLNDTTTITAPIATNGRTRTTAYTWGTYGQLLSVDGPLPGAADTVSMTYDAQGQLATTTNPLGHVTQVLTRNALGRPLTVRDANGVDTVMTYDSMGRVLTVTNNPGPDQSLYTMEYDAGGNMAKMTMPMGGWLAFTYDGANRVTRIDNQRGEYQTYTLNALGQPTAEAVAAPGGTITRSSTKAYDELGRLIRNIGANGETWQFNYDLEGNLIKTTDGRGKDWTDSHDALDRPVTSTNPELQAENTVYRSDDAVIQFRDGRNLATNSVVDGFGLTLQQTSPDTGTTQYRYDEASRLIQSTDADGVQSDYTYDAAGRLLTEVSAKAGLATQTVTYGYDSVAGGNKGIGRLTSVTDPSGSASFTYDAQGRLTTAGKAIGTQSYALQYTYDANGEVTSVTYPSGHVVDYVRDVDGQVTAVKARAAPGGAQTTLASAITWKPFGPLAGLTYGNGLTLTRGHDGNYALSSLALSGSSGALVDLAFTRDANGNVTAVTDNLGAARDASYTYSDAGRLSTATGAWGSDAYQWDANSNRIRADRTVGASTFSDVATIAAASNQLTEVRDGAGVLAKTLAFTPGGDTASVTPASGPAQTYTYDARGRLASVSLGGTVQAAYSYDWTGQRVARTQLGSAEVHYLFDGGGHLLAEHDAASGAVLREYVWLGDTVVAMVTGTSSPTYSFITTGNLNEPLLVTDASGAVTSNMTRDPWGNVFLFAGGSVIELGYPGQWRDSASGLWQNWMRDYDPTLGRYAEVDPIGLDGGSNLYAYVGGNPVNRIDPLGLSWGNAFSQFGCWLVGCGSGQDFFTPGSSEVKEMQNAPGVNAARQAYIRKNNLFSMECDCNDAQPLTNYRVRFGLKGLFKAGLNATQQFVGSYRVDIYPAPGCKRLVIVTNTTSFKSFFYGLAPDWERSTFRPMGNMRQNYTWIE